MSKKRLFGKRKKSASAKARKGIKKRKSATKVKRPSTRITRQGSTRRWKSRMRTRTVNSTAMERKRRSSLDAAEPLVEHEIQDETENHSRTTEGELSSLVVEEEVEDVSKSSKQVIDEEMPFTAHSISSHKFYPDEQSIDISPIKEPISPDLKKATFRRCGSYYNQWKDKVFFKLPKRSKNKHMVLVKLLEETGTNWPESVEAYDALGVVFLSQAGSVELDRRTRDIRVLGRKDKVKVKSTKAIAKHLNYLTVWLKKCRTLLKENKLNAVFEGLVSATIAFFDESIMLDSSENLRMEIRGLREMWGGLMLKTNEELEIEPISRDGVEKMLSDVCNHLPATIRADWERTQSMGTLV